MRRPYRRQTRTPERERGIAIVTVLLVVALAATLAASVVWRQLVAVRDVENLRLNVESMWAERAAVEWARATLRAQSATTNVAYDGQVWAAPVKDIQLDSFLPRDAIAVNSELGAARISGVVEDAQARFNLMNLVSRPAPSQPWQIDGTGVLAYRRLLGALSLNQGLAQLTAAYIVRSLGDGSGAGGWPAQLVSTADLARIPGYDAQVAQTLAPFVTILPNITAINANTAAEPALIAAIPTLSQGQAHALIAHRGTGYFISTADIAEALYATGTTAAELPAGSLVDVTSGYFIVHCRIHSARINTRVDTLIARYGIGQFSWTAVIWVHRLAD